MINVAVIICLDLLILNRQYIKLVVQESGSGKGKKTPQEEREVEENPNPIGSTSELR